MDTNFKIEGSQGLEGLTLDKPQRSGKTEGGFAESFKEAIGAVDDLQHQSETAQIDYAQGGDVELHDVLIKIEEAELAFKTMMGIRSKLVEAYREVMRMGG